MQGEFALHLLFEANLHTCLYGLESSRNLNHVGSSS